MIDRAGILFASFMGIGQKISLNSTCNSFSQCPYIRMYSTFLNDASNVLDFFEYNERGLPLTGEFKLTKNKLLNPTKKTIHLHIVLSLTALNVNKPKSSYHILKWALSRNYTSKKNKHPSIFKQIGELNLAKQAIQLSGKEMKPLKLKKIPKLNKLMKVITKRNLPLLIHCDIGNDIEPTKYLPLLHTFLKTYNNTTIIWAHMGICREQTFKNVSTHINIVKDVLDKYPNVYIDLAWTIIMDQYFKFGYEDPNIHNIQQYIDFINSYSHRILSGSDFVGRDINTYYDYKKTVEKTSFLFKYIDNKAFRNIVLGHNYIQLFQLTHLYETPQVEGSPLTLTQQNFT